MVPGGRGQATKTLGRPRVQMTDRADHGRETSDGTRKTREWRCIGSEWIPRVVRLIKADRNRLTEFDALLTTVQK